MHQEQHQRNESPQPELHILTAQSHTNTVDSGTGSRTGSYDKPQLSPQPSISSMKSESPHKPGLRSKVGTCKLRVIQ